MQSSFVIPLLLCISLAGYAQDHPVAAEAQSFIPPGYSSLDYIPGDLNGDKKPDAILILKQPGEDSLDMDDTHRPFIILIRKADGKLKQVIRNDNAIMCRHCGGVFGDPYHGVQIYAGGFNISFYGGSNWRWAYQYKFAYKPAKKNWYLVNESQSNFNSTDPEMTMTEEVIGEEELGNIPLEKFNADPTGDSATKWQVKAIKTFFYDSPKLGDKHRKGYLVKGDKVTGYRQLTNFIHVLYDNGKGDFTNGYILKKDLEKIQ